MVERVGFTGHRDRVTELSLLDWMRSEYPGAVWVHGGAGFGFDAQVAGYAKAWEIPTEVIRPDYDRYRDRPKVAPLKRNEVIVSRVQVLVACWDGREKGGTFYTIRHGRHLKQHHLRALNPVFAASSSTGMSQARDSVWVGFRAENLPLEFRLPGGGY
jgi:hypothetical protein